MSITRTPWVTLARSSILSVATPKARARACAPRSHASATSRGPHVPPFSPPLRVIDIPPHLVIRGSPNEPDPQWAPRWKMAGGSLAKDGYRTSQPRWSSMANRVDSRFALRQLKNHEPRRNGRNDSEGTKTFAVESNIHSGSDAAVRELVKSLRSIGIDPDGRSVTVLTRLDHHRHRSPYWVGAARRPSSASALSSQYVIPISRYIIVAVARCSCACSRLPVRR